MIDEKDLIKDIKECKAMREFDWTTETLISLLESAPKVSQWIPTSERLPNEYGNYQITNHNEEVEEATFVPSMNRGLIYGWSVCHADGTHFVDDDYVKAWQPLPEPWKESVKE